MTALINDESIQKYQDMVRAAVIPDYFLPEQFCNSGVQSIDYVIPPVSSADPAAASLETGAPPLQQVRPSLGGAVFPRQQYNGALRLLSNILSYLNKGNNFTFDTNNIAGYTLGAVLFDYNSYRWVRSLKDNNTANFITNPNLIDGVNWDFISVNPKTATAFTIAPTVPTLPIGTNTTQIASTAFVQAQIKNNIPAGGIFCFAMSTPPTGFLVANGSAISRTVYSDLFAAIGTIWGTGDGSTTFNIPDLRGEFIRGWDNGRGLDSGRVFGSQQNQSYLSHVHGDDHKHEDTGHQHSIEGFNSGGGGSIAANGGSNLRSFNTGESYAIINYKSEVPGQTGSTNPSGGDETRPVNVAMLYCIKY